MTGKERSSDKGRADNTKRCVIVTGASRGIGAACTQSLLDAGHAVIGLSRQRGHMPAEALHKAVDLSDLKSAVEILQDTLREHPVDTLICNAGRGDIASLENFSILVRHCLPTFKRRPRSDIVFIGSESALKGGRFGTLYSAAKFGLRGAAQALRAECASANCHVGIVQPGMVRTEFFNQLSFEPGPEPSHAIDPATPDESMIEEITVNPRQNVVSRKPDTPPDR